MSRRIRSLAALLACLLVVALLSALRARGVDEPRYYDSGPDGWAHAPSASAHLDRLRLTHTVTGAGLSQPLSSSQTLVVAEVTVVVRHRALPLQTLRLHTADGAVYNQLTDSGLPTLTLTEPGWTIHGSAVFEVPPERLAGASVVIGAQADLLVIYRAMLRFPGVVPDGTVESSVELPAVRTEVTR